MIAAVALGAALLAAAPDPADVRIRNARVVHGDGRVSPRATIVIRGRRVSAIVPATQVPPPAARDIDVAGRTVIPGLIDVDVHVADWALPLWLRAGITTVRDLRNDPSYILPLASRDGTDRPRIVAAGAMLEEGAAERPDVEIVRTPGDVHIAVRRAAFDGVDVVSIGPRTSLAVVSQITNEAQARGIPVTVRLGWTNASEAALAGVSTIEQLAGIPDATSDDPERTRRTYDPPRDILAAARDQWQRVTASTVAAVAAELRSRLVSIVPSLLLYQPAPTQGRPTSASPAGGVPADVRGWNPASRLARPDASIEPDDPAERAWQRQRQFVARFVKLGGRIATGTTSPSAANPPGASLYRELQLAVEAGLSPAAALRAATVDAAAVLGISDVAGTIAPGKDADLVIVDGDPLTDISAVARVRAVIRLGRVVELH